MKEDGRITAHVIEALCKGCGVCVAACPSSAIGQHLFEDIQIFSEIKGLLAGSAAGNPGNKEKEV